MNKIICACGCGNKFIPSKKKVRYIHGHSNSGKHISTYGKTWEQLFGKQRAMKRKIELGNKRRGISTSLLGKSWEFQKNIQSRKQQARDRLLGKSYENRYGPEKAKEIKYKLHIAKVLVVDKEYLLNIKKEKGHEIKFR